MARINIEFFKSKTYKNGEHPIMLRLSHKSTHKYIYTGRSILEKDWDSEKNLPRSPKLRNYINNKYTSAENILLDLEKGNRSYTIDELVSKIKLDNNLVSFCKYLDERVESLRKAKRIGYAESYKTTKNVINTFTNGKDITFESIDNKWLKDFEDWHISNNNTVGGLGVYMRNIRALYNQAIRDQKAKLENYPFGRAGYQIPTQPTRKRAISKEKIKAISELSLKENSSLWHAKNYFLFSFYCRGMNWVDMANLKPSNIVNGRLEYIRIKTKRKSAKAFSIKVTGQTQEILNIYRTGKEQDEFIFPIIHRKSADDIRKDIKNELKTYNKYLKKLGDLVGVEGGLTSYSARHSWGTIGKRSGVELSVISEGYGHADTNVTRVYLDSIENDDIDDANELITSL